jgi:hypothetical protein
MGYSFSICCLIIYSVAEVEMGAVFLSFTFKN